MKIISIEIKRFRSINNLKLKLSDEKNLITLCGQNNVGKTNVLRALNLFFGHSPFIKEKDMPEYKQMTGGASTYPLVKLEFINKGKTHIISKDYNPKNIAKTSSLLFKIEGSSNNKLLSEEEALSFLKKINFFYLPSINISFPELINFLIDDQFLDIEFGKARMSGKKADIKTNLENARIGLQGILDDLTASVDPQFKEFHNSWGIKFDVPTNVNKFREVINNEIDFLITDDTQTAIQSKGSGLQRLGHMLIVMRIIEKLVEKEKFCLVLIDEPDIYLHYQLQKKLKSKIDELSKKTQVLITTHSPIFINPYNLTNLFLLHLEVKNSYSTRKQKAGNILETSLIDLTTKDSVHLVKETLGIEDTDSFLIANHNLIVEGGEDKKYLEELIQVFNLPMPNIISAEGANNIIKWLDFYNAMAGGDDKPIFKVLFDNDNAGREEKYKIDKKIKNHTFQNIDIDTFFIIDVFNSNFSNNKINIEIEDFIYPEIIIKLANEVFSAKTGFKKISPSETLKKIKNLSQRATGILRIIDNCKNDKNPDIGINFPADSQGFKGGMANLFNLKGNHDLAQEIVKLDKKYPKVKKFLVKLTKND